MRKKGLTIIELTIAIALLSIISAAIFSLFATATKNYTLQSQKSLMQKELNFVIDALANEIKSATGTEDEHEGSTLSENTLILKLPALDESSNFIYGPAGMEFDYIIYTLGGTQLRKVVSPHINSKRPPKDSVVLADVSAFLLSYQPNQLTPKAIETTISLNRTVGKNNVRLEAKRSGYMRNQ
jgi:prepilin-type N-terminal cleavage/methylation domain-containing protein